MKMNVKNKNMTWKHVYENMNRTRLDYDYDAAMLLKKKHLKKIAAWGGAAYANKLKPVLWHSLWY